MAFPALLSVAVITPLATDLAAQQGGTEADPTPILNRNSSVERELAAAESDSYQVVLEAGGLLLLEVEQLGIDVALTALSPDGQIVAQSDSNGHTAGREFLKLMPAENARYGIRVKAYAENPQAGRYRLRVMQLLNQQEAAAYRVAEAEQRAAVEAWVSETLIQQVNHRLRR